MKKKSIEYYMSLPYELRLIPEEEFGGFVGYIEELPGCLTNGKTASEVVENMEDAKRCWLEAALEDGVKIKEPQEHNYSGDLRIRMPKSLHRALAIRAKAEGVSMNQFCTYAIQKAVQE